MGAYKGPASTIKDAEKREESFKKGGKAKKACGGKLMSAASKPTRATGGGVFSAARSGSPRGKASHY